MKLQALILIFVIVISFYVLKEGSSISQGKSEIDQSVGMASLGEINNGEPIVVKEEITVIPANAVVESPKIEKDEELPINCRSVSSKIFAIKDLDDNKVILEKNPDNHWPVASITKLMTAIVALENLNLSSVVEITQEAILSADGFSTLAIKEKYSVEDLLEASLVFSSNDASYALAQGLGQDIFVQKMNDKAKEIGMSQTSFVEPSGLSYLNQSTANDLATLLSYIYRNHPLILNMTRQKTASIKERVSGKTKKFSNIDLFAGQSNFFGGKTGFIDQSGGNLVTLFQKGGKMFFVGVLGSQDRFGEVSKLLECIE
ncbi:MAG: serine hydrolase [Candidatus Paceibacterota bacterium]|jgi:D-alanyl-D-alanine carboxypeptidase